MSFRTWITYGYGICFNEPIDTTVEKVERLLDHAPKLRSSVHQYLRTVLEEGKEPTLENYMEYDKMYHAGIAYLVAKTIYEAENIEITIADDFDGNGYLMYCPDYPWVIRKRPREYQLTEEGLDDIFRKYINILTDQEYGIDYQEAENGG